MFFKNLVTLPEAQGGRPQGGRLGGSPIEEVPQGKRGLFGQMMRKRIFSIRPELFFQDDQEEAS